MNHDDILDNRAELLHKQEADPDDNDDLRHSELVFALQDKHHIFSLSLSTIFKH